MASWEVESRLLCFDQTPGTRYLEGATGIQRGCVASCWMGGEGGRAPSWPWPLCVLVSVFSFGVSSGLCPHLVCHVSLRVSHLCLSLL